MVQVTTERPIFIISHRTGPFIHLSPSLGKILHTIKAPGPTQPLTTQTLQVLTSMPLANCIMEATTRSPSSQIAHWPKNKMRLKRQVTTNCPLGQVLGIIRHLFEHLHRLFHPQWQLLSTPHVPDQMSATARPAVPIQRLLHQVLNLKCKLPNYIFSFSMLTWSALFIYIFALQVHALLVDSFESRARCLCHLQTALVTGYEAFQIITYSLAFAIWRFYRHICPCTNAKCTLYSLYCDSFRAPLLQNVPRFHFATSNFTICDPFDSCAS